MIKRRQVLRRTLKELTPREPVQDMHLLLCGILGRLVGLDPLPQPVASFSVRDMHKLHSTSGLYEL